MKHFMHVLAIAGLGIGFYALARTLEFMALEYWLVPAAGVTINDWLADFMNWTLIIIILSTVMSLAWYCLAAWKFRAEDWRKVNKRGWWYLLSLPVVVVALVGCALSYAAQEFAWIAYIFYIMNGVCCYFLATALNTPASFKYIPLGATALRRWR